MTDTTGNPVGVGVAKPIGDYLYDPEDWECTYDRGSVSEYLTEGPLLADRSAVVKLHQFKEIEPTFAALIPVSWTEDGDVDEDEVRFFPTEEAARTALQLTKTGDV